jgi:hypothetical protein
MHHNGCNININSSGDYLAWNISQNREDDVEQQIKSTTSIEKHSERWNDHCTNRLAHVFTKWHLEKYCQLYLLMNFSCPLSLATLAVNSANLRSRTFSSPP